ncbi:Rne/Rng family ribonuclease [bacterium]|nr:Rne/Rng family ribonuclease [bacterium]
MEIKIVVNSQVHETRIAILEDDDLVEVLVERPEERRIVGNIYKGKVENVLPEIQAAFIDIGLEKRAFLHISDIGYYDAFPDSEMDEITHLKKHKKKESIQNLLKTGDDILIQIIKEPIGSKGPKATTQLSLAGRYLVMIPGADHVGVSREIRQKQQRSRLRRIAQQFKMDGMGLIVRTIADKQKLKVLHQDYENLLKSWDTMKKKAEALPAPTLVYKDIGLTAKIVRDFFSTEVNTLIMDSKEEYKSINSYLEKVAPHLLKRVKLYKEKQPIFDAYSIENQINQMLSRAVPASKGIYIVIERTEALTVIDVNAGKFSSKLDHDEAILEANISAMGEIGKQIRLRDIGGIIVIDFIDMEDENCRKKLNAEIKDVLKKDKSPTRFIPINEFGMVNVTRKRIKPSVLQSITEVCPTCKGSGVHLTPTSVITLLERWLIRGKFKKYEELIVIAHPTVCAELIPGEPSNLKNLETNYKIRLKLISDISMSYDKFTILESRTGEDITEKFIA